MERLCQYCAQRLQGRSDKKFCDDACRNAYNNRRLQEDHPQMRRVNHQLKRNRKILCDWFLAGKRKQTLAEFQSARFDFEHHTSMRIGKAGNLYLYCYDYGYLALESGDYLLVKKDKA